MFIIVMLYGQIKNLVFCICIILEIIDMEGRRHIRECVLGQKGLKYEECVLKFE